MKLWTAARVWLFIIGGALAYDVLAIRQDMETLSSWCRRHPRTTVLCGGYLLLHLIGRPEALRQVDPLHMVADKIR